MVYNFIPSTAPEVPILISVPHCGTLFPDELVNQFDSKLVQAPDDTDWWVDRLYDFAPSLGMCMVTARYSRWVVDLNRDPHDKPLYTDGRYLTGLCPITTFLGAPLYIDQRTTIDPVEVNRRTKEYYYPYHLKIERELSRLKNRFGKVLLWDCHSIRQIVKTIQSEKFPDLILGDADGTSASAAFSELASSQLGHGSYSLAHNHPFKGGYITRRYGKPGFDQHALQLEMTKVNYMDDSENNFDPDRANNIRNLLQPTFRKLIALLIGK
jgi:N-formylglutamate deformylase